MKSKRVICLLMATILTVINPISVLADRVDGETNSKYVSLGADLSATEKATVLQLLGLTESDLSNCTVETITNQMEHEYLDSYLDSSVIGTRALSSVLVEEKEDGNGIKVTTQNISYCTVGMYQNALATAGIENADITVVGPFSISGTAGLVGAIKAYENMTGETVSESSVDTATNELVVTSDLAEDIGDSEKAEQLVGFVKNEVASNNYTEEEISDLIDQAATEMDITLSEEDKSKILSLMDKIDDLDINVDQLKEQVEGLYDKLSDLNLNIDLNSEETQNFFSNLFQKVVDFFSNIFG